MLKSLTLRNFQAHKKLKIVLGPHVNTIVGPSDVGKSAVIRALRLLALNDMRGKSFVRHGSKNAHIEVEVDKSTIEREKGTKNTYVIDEAELKAFGNDVPPEVQDVLNLGLMNFQAQHDGPFWFSATAGEVSRQLNQIVNLGVIDSTLANLDSKARKDRSTTSVLEGQLKNAKERKKDLRFARDMDSQLEEIEKLEYEHEESVKKTSSLESLISAATQHSADKERMTSACESAQTAIDAGEAWIEIHMRETKLMRLTDRIEELHKEANLRIPDVEPLFKLHVGHRAARTERAVLEAMIDDVNTKRAIWEEHKKLAELGQQNFEAALEGKECPLCGRTES